MRQIAVPVIAAALASMVTYFVCDSINSDTIADLKEQNTILEKASQEAKVIQRISEQMEDIAFQQKSISDKQREAAMEQKKIADMERGKAEIERGLAQTAEHKALASAKEAEQMRMLADQQKEEAVKNMRAAELARAQTDTLYYLSLGTTLAQSSESFGLNITNLSRLLAYSSWYYTKHYGGNVYDQDVFKALLFSSNNIERINDILKGSVRALHIVNIDGGKWTLGVTDCGEWLCYNTKKEHLYFISQGHIYRDMTIIDDRYCAALTADGKVTLVDYSKSVKESPDEINEIQLPDGLWNNILTTNDPNTLIAISDKEIIWLNSKTLAISKRQSVDSEVTAVGKENGIIHIFGKGNKHYITDQDGILVSRPLDNTDWNITSYSYIASHGIHAIGTADGKVYIVDKEGKITNALTGHSGAITCIGFFNDYLVTTSYDRSLRYWDLRNTSSIVSAFNVNFDKWPLTFKIDNASNIIWIGNADGHVNRYCIDPNENARATQMLLTDDFTPAEWSHYIGPHIPFRSFLPLKNQEGGDR